MAADGAASLTLRFGTCDTSPCSGTFPGIYVISDSATTGAPAGSWAAVRLMASYDGDDWASGAMLIENSTDQPSEVSFANDPQLSEYVLLGQVGGGDLVLRFQVSSPTNFGTTTYIDRIR